MKTYEVHGPSARSRVLRFTTAENALWEACSRIYASADTRARTLASLAEGKKASIGYGFSEVTIYVKEV